jgi:hypothetical protein
MNMNIKLIVIGILAPCCFGSNIASAQQSDPISTDRPSFSTSPLVVGTGIWQLETGYLYQQSNSDSSSHSLPNAHIRFGLSDEVELRMIWAGYSRRESGSSSSTGYSDASIGAKWQLTESDARTQFAFIADISIPIGGDAFSSDSYDPGIGLAWAHHGSLDWFGTAAVSQSGGDSNLTNGVGLSFAIDEERVWFVEHEMSIPENGSTAHSLNGGAGFLRGLNTQIDVHASLGLNDQAADWSIGVGWSKRF